MALNHLFSLDLEQLPSLESDFLIVGSGIAGLFAAYKASKLGAVLVVTKQRAEDSNTEWAQGGIAAAVDEDDSPILHLEDTLEAGAGFCDARSVEILVTEGPSLVMELVDLGVRFDREGSAWDLGREAAHRRRRILHASDATGGEVARILIQKCRNDQRITLREGCFLVDFLKSSPDGRCVGALMLDGKSGGFVVCRAPVVIVATGGTGQLYQTTTNPEVATGDGAAAAYRAGAELMDMEFVQFHPTALSMPNAPHFLISEAVRGEGALLRNVRGERFMPRYHQLAELAPRDVVSRAVFREMQETQTDHVLLDISQLEPSHFQARFPNISDACRQYGLDPASGYIPVSPATHFIMGGIKTGIDGDTNIPGLYACGEAACSGVHGANRLASNSLLEGLVFGARAVASGWQYLSDAGSQLDRHGQASESGILFGDRARGEIKKQNDKVNMLDRVDVPHEDERGRALPVPEDRHLREADCLLEQVYGATCMKRAGALALQKKVCDPETSLSVGNYDWKALAQQVRAIMWEQAGIIRNYQELSRAAAGLERLNQGIANLAPTRESVEAVNLLTLGMLTVAAALMRTESRGGHFRSDFPSRDDAYWLRHVIFQA